MTGGARSPLAAAVAGLLLLAAALFVVGSTVERNSAAGHTELRQTASVAETTTGDSVKRVEGEAGEGEAAESGQAEKGSVETAYELAEESEPLAALESPAAVIGVVVVSILLACAVFFRPQRPTLAAVAIFTVVAAALDIVELINQVKEDRSGLAVLVGLILLLRILTLVGTARLWRAAEPATS